MAGAVVGVAAAGVTGRRKSGAVWHGILALQVAGVFSTSNLGAD